MREYQARYKERHPERAAEGARRRSQAHRDRYPERTRERERADAARRREADPDQFRRWYRQNLERERKRGREAAQLRRRLTKLGLPPRKIHKTYAVDRRKNAAAADEFFSRRWRINDRIRAESFEALPGHRAAVEFRARYLAAGAIEKADTRDREARARAIVDAARQRLPAKQLEQITEEVRMDSVARQLRGAAAFNIDAEVQRRVHELVVERALSTPIDAHERDEMRRLIRASFPTHAQRGTRPPSTQDRPQRLRAGPQDRGYER
ncbi:hypothetical protein ACIGEP_16565 [Microbacterium sp. NPDC077663]|uniref:hypothetical protein n=1 Tax=Microbacterium sp. NPDC077663 TaxID=3364189 RepID=UPI0037CB6B64